MNGDFKTNPTKRKNDKHNAAKAFRGIWSGTAGIKKLNKIKFSKLLMDLKSRMKAASKRAKAKELPNTYFHKGERPACRHCRWEGETVTKFSYCQGLAKCNMHTFSRKPKNA